MNNINTLSNNKLYMGKIKDISRKMINLIIITVEIDNQLYSNKIWGHCIDTTNYTEDQYEEYLENEDGFVLNKFYRKFNIDFEDRDILINRNCLCRKSNYLNRPYLKILKVA